MKTNFLSTAIGSMPFDDKDYAIGVSLDCLDAPIWPQLSAYGLLEQMEIQYSENMPCVVIDKEKGRMFFKTDDDYSEVFGDFYVNWEEASEAGSDLDFMAITEDYSKGLYALFNKLQKDGKKLPWLKVQTTGPCSFALTIVDQDKRAIYYNEEFRDVIIKALGMKCRWQIQKFSPFCENIICFIDEPILSAFGSSTYVSVSRDEVVAALNEVIEEVHKEGGLAGIHCCGNTEWSILIDAGVDIVNFDAFEFGETIAMYPEHVKKHLEAGKILAWGIVPTSAAVQSETVETLEKRLEEAMDNLAAKGVDKNLIVSQAMITPSCGTGSLDVKDAEKVFALTKALTKRMKEKYGV